MKKISTKKKLAIGVTTAASVILLGAGTWAYAAPYSYVSLDVNPSIEYTLNMFDRVIDVDAVNEDGQAILEDTGELKNMTIEDAIEKTIDQIDEAGYLDGTSVATTETTIPVDNTTTTETTAPTVDTTAATETTVPVEDTAAESTATDTSVVSNPEATTETGNVTTGTDVVGDTTVDGGIIITVSSGNTQLSEDLTEQIRNTVEDMVGENIEVEVLSIGRKRVEEARTLGVSPGKLNLVEKLRASSTDPASIVTEEWINKPVKDIMHAIKVNRKADTSLASSDVIEEAGEPLQDSDVAEEAENDQDQDDKDGKSLKNHAKANETLSANDMEEEDFEESEDSDEADKEVKERAEEKANKAKEKAEEKAKKAIEKAANKAEHNDDAYQQDKEDQDINEDQDDEDKYLNADEDQDSQKAWENDDQDNDEGSNKAWEGNKNNRGSRKNEN